MSSLGQDNQRKLVIAASLLAAACGGDLERSTQATGGASAGSTSLTSGSGGAIAAGGNTSVFATMPSECAPDTNPSGGSNSSPSTVEFILTNTTSEYRYVATDEECRVDFQVFSCADGYQKDLIVPICSMSCGGTFVGCITCTPCAPGAKELSPASTWTETWSGVYDTYEQLTPGCGCYHLWPAPAGKYRAVFKVYDTNPAVDPSSSATTVTVDFDYPDEDGRVVVEVS